MLVVQTGNELNLLDAGTLNRLGAGGLPSCTSGDVAHAAGDTIRGLWVPLNEYGFKHIPVIP